jgi:hypothetical protein
MASDPELPAERRRWLRQKVHTPAYASFDGVTGGMILDLSEAGMGMQATAPLEANRKISLQLSLSEPGAHLETSGYVAWADALGRAGVRFSDLPEESRQRLQQWLEINDAAPSRKAPKFSMGEFALPALETPSAEDEGMAPPTINLELEVDAEVEQRGPRRASTTVQYEFNSLGPDLNAALRLISQRACSLTRGTGAAIALAHRGAMICRATVGSKLDANSGFSGECIRSGKALRCDDAETDPRVNLESCQRMGIRSVLAAPVRYEREVIGLLEVFSTYPFAFDEGDVAVAERLAQTVLLAMSQRSGFERG